MLVDAVVLTLVGTVAVLLPMSRSYRSHLTHRLAQQAGAQVPADQVPALEARVTRRARGMGAGIVVAGLAVLVVALGWPDARGSGYLLVSLMVTFGAAGLAAVEILRPGGVTAGPRWARSTAPTLSDYVPPLVRVLGRVLTGVGMVVLLLALALGRTRWFDADTVWRSPVPVLVVALPVLVLLSELAVRRVLDAPQPARDEAELYWQDAVRANTLSSLTVPPALVGLLALVVSGAVLDDAASAVAVATGQVGPTWTTWLLVTGYVLPFLVLVGALAATTLWGGTEMQRFRDRLWGGRPLGGSTTTVEA